MFEVELAYLFAPEKHDDVAILIDRVAFLKSIIRNLENALLKEFLI